MQMYMHCLLFLLFLHHYVDIVLFEFELDTKNKLYILVGFRRCNAAKNVSILFSSFSHTPKRAKNNVIAIRFYFFLENIQNRQNENCETPFDSLEAA